MPRTAKDQPSAEAELPLTPAVFNILLALADGEKHGYAIIQEVREDTGGAAGPPVARAPERAAAHAVFIARINTSATSLRLNSFGGRSPFESMSRTFVPESETRSLSSWNDWSMTCRRKTRPSRACCRRCKHGPTN